MSEYPFQVALAPYLIAVGDEHRLLVHRSRVMNDSDPAVEYVADYIEATGMALVSTETGLVDGMFGLTETARYAATPEGFAAWASHTNTEESAA